MSEEFDKEAYEAGEKVIRQDFMKASKIYVDLGILKYIKLGLMFSCPNMTAKIYREVLDYLNSKEFLTRDTDCPRYAMASLEIVEPFFDSCILNGHSDDQVLLQSPPFDTETEILSLINKVRHGNKVFGDNDDITIYINIAELPDITDRLQECIIRAYQELFRVNVELINVEFSEFTEEAILKYDTYFIDNLAQFNHHFVDILDERKFFEKFIYTKRVLPDNMLDDIENINITEFFTTVQAVMGCAVNFQFIRTPGVVMGE